MFNNLSPKVVLLLHTKGVCSTNMKNELIKLLLIHDKNSFIKNVSTNVDTKIIEIVTYLIQHYCEKCECKLRSKGINVRKIEYPTKIIGINFTIFH